MNEKLTSLPPDVFQAEFNALAKTFGAGLPQSLERWTFKPASRVASRFAPPPSPSLTVKGWPIQPEAAVKILYRAVSAGRLRAVRIAAGRNLRFRAEWVDEWL